VARCFFNKLGDCLSQHRINMSTINIAIAFIYLNYINI
jgi:hypothetical protein